LLGETILSGSEGDKPMSEQATLMCATCDTPVKSRVDAPGEQDAVFCPDCGVEDTLANAAEEANAYVREQESQAVMADLRRAVNGADADAGSDAADGEVKDRPRAGKTFRFKAEYPVSGASCGCGAGGCGS
jgi:DNA-directed RNA polymerase subunit RPC12/RpoP